MNSESKELHAFMKQVHDYPRDVKTRKVFADWLEDHDEPELADEQRNFSLEKYDAEQYLRKFAEKYDNGEDNWKRMLRGLIEGEYCFGSDYGPENARYDNELWDAVRTLSDNDLPDDHFTDGHFRCAC